MGSFFKGGVTIDTLHDYIRWIADSMGVSLTEEKVNDIALELIQSEKYKDLVQKVEVSILDRS